MNRWVCGNLFLWILLACPTGRAENVEPSIGSHQLDNPAPAAGDLALPMPDGHSMVFRPVFLGIGDAPLALREFKVGDRIGGGFQESPTDVALGGSFVSEKKGGQRDWLFYLGKYEVTESQYYALMEPERQVSGNYPVRDVSWFEVAEFVHRYNLWLLKNAADRLPKNGDTSGFVRLPSEIEWEFAARGGDAVNENAFDRAQPYGEDLMRHEWFSGPDSSHNKVREIGLLSPNPLGLHDMLGNVAEMTSSFYQPEYYQGRQGGLVARGGDIFTPKKQMRSSLRNEQPFYTRDGAPARSPTLGFRLAMGSVIYSSPKVAREMEVAWEEYRRTRRIPTPATQSAAPVSASASKRTDEIRKLIGRIEGSLLSDPGNADLKSQLGLLESSLRDIESVVAKAEADSASAWVKIACNTAYELSKEMGKLRQSELLLEMMRQTGGEQLKADEARHKRLLENIEQAWTQYGDAIRQLQKIEPSLVDAQFDAFREHVIALDIPRQAEVIMRAKKHCADYRENGRVDVDAWGMDLRGVWQD